MAFCTPVCPGSKTRLATPFLVAGWRSLRPHTLFRSVKAVPRGAQVIVAKASKATGSRRSMTSEYRERTRRDLDRILAYLPSEVTRLLPEVVVVGDQSSGKSSVLESLSGIALPRGNNLVTRCPLQLSLRQGPEHAEIAYGDGDDRITRQLSVDKIAAAIEEATRTLAGTKKGIVNKLIHLTVSLPDAPDLTLTDLPGIVRTPVGDQPADIEQQVKRLIIEHATGDAKVILAVLPATHDLATHTALQIASDLDPKGERTLGVITKIDVQPAGLRQKLDGSDPNAPSLKLGMVGVLNRSPEDFARRVSSEDMLEKEDAFFEDHADLKDLSPSCKGKTALVTHQVYLQKQRIRSFLLDFKRQLLDTEAQVAKKIEKHGGAVKDEAEAHQAMVHCLTSLYRHFGELTHARYDMTDDVDKRAELRMAPRINELAKQHLQKAWDAVGGKAWLYSEASYQRLVDIMRESDGVTLPDCTVSDAVGDTYRNYIWGRLEAPAQAFLSAVHDKVTSVLHALIDTEFEQYSHLGQFFKEKMSEKLNEAKLESLAELTRLIKRQKVVYTSNSSYSEMVGALDHIITQVKAAQAAADDYRRQQMMTAAMSKFASLAGVSVTNDCIDDEQVKAKWEDLVYSVKDKDEWLAKEQVFRSQFRLGAFTQVVMQLLWDEIPKLARSHLVHEVGNSILSMMTHFHDKDGNLFSLMEDPEKLIQLKRNKKLLAKIQTARQEVSRI